MAERRSNEPHSDWRNQTTMIPGDEGKQLCVTYDNYLSLMSIDALAEVIGSTRKDVVEGEISSFASSYIKVSVEALLDSTFGNGSGANIRKTHESLKKKLGSSVSDELTTISFKIFSEISQKIQSE